MKTESPLRITVFGGTGRTGILFIEQALQADHSVTAPVRAPQDQPKLFDKLMGFLLKTLSGDVLRDSEAYANAIRNSGLDWTLVRVPMTTEGAPTGNYRVGWAGCDMGF